MDWVNTTPSPTAVLRCLIRQREPFLDLRHLILIPSLSFRPPLSKPKHPQYIVKFVLWRWRDSNPRPNDFPNDVNKSICRHVPIRTGNNGFGDRHDTNFNTHLLESLSIHGHHQCIACYLNVSFCCFAVSELGSDLETSWSQCIIRSTDTGSLHIHAHTLLSWSCLRLLSVMNSISSGSQYKFLLIEGLAESRVLETHSVTCTQISSLVPSLKDLLSKIPTLPSSLSESNIQ